MVTETSQELFTATLIDGYGGARIQIDGPGEVETIWLTDTGGGLVGMAASALAEHRWRQVTQWVPEFGGVMGRGFTAQVQQRSPDYCPRCGMNLKDEGYPICHKTDEGIECSFVLD